MVSHPGAGWLKLPRLFATMNWTVKMFVGLNQCALHPTQPALFVPEEPVMVALPFNEQLSALSDHSMGASGVRFGPDVEAPPPSEAFPEPQAAANEHVADIIRK
ncbi:MAG: hypothetical protein NVS2B16_30430 [Chloroflexota bacterium]